MAPIGSPAISIDDDQRFALMKFRRSVQDIVRPEHDDHFLLRWLRARQWNAEAAEKMLRDSMEWREKWGIDTTLKDWDAPEALVKYFPSGTSGFDKEGSPVIIVPFAGLDVWGILHSASKNDCIKMVVRHLEGYLESAKKQAEKHGMNAMKVVVIFDMDGFNMRQYVWRPAADMVVSLLQVYEANYPEILKICFIVNAPKVFSVAFSIVKKFMNDYTLSKIKIFSSDAKKWQPQLLTVVDADQLPVHYGGTMVDENGDPKCSSMVKLGGKVPKEMYTKRLSQDKETKFTRVTVKTGGVHTVDLICAQPGCFLKWDFGVENHEIHFSIKRRDEDGNESVVHGPTKVAGEGVIENGVIPASGPATYTVVFDNSSSIVRSKKIFYDVLITPPLDDLGVGINAEDSLGSSEKALESMKL